MNILGLNAFHGDSSAALLRNGMLVAAIEEERLNRIKHWAGLPVAAASAVLSGTDPGDLEHIAISRNLKANLWRKLLRVATRPDSWSQARRRGSNALKLTQIQPDLAAAIGGGLGQAARQARFHYVEHHRAHLASAFFASPFDEAAIASIDGFGDFASTMSGFGRGSRLHITHSTRFPDSLGTFYTAFTQLLGFPNYGDEYKMMGLAAFGEPRFAPQIRNVIRWIPNLNGGQFRLNLDYFIHHSEGAEMTWEGGQPFLANVYSGKMTEVFGPPRPARSELLPVHADMAASVQLVFEEIYSRS